MPASLAAVGQYSSASGFQLYEQSLCVFLLLCWAYMLVFSLVPSVYLAVFAFVSELVCSHFLCFLFYFPVF